MPGKKNVRIVHGLKLKNMGQMQDEVQFLKIQGYQCLRCRKTFNEYLKFGESMHYQGARLYFTEESSYRAVVRQLGITRIVYSKFYI